MWKLIYFCAEPTSAHLQFHFLRSGRWRSMERSAETAVQRSRCLIHLLYLQVFIWISMFSFQDGTCLSVFKSVFLTEFVLDILLHLTVYFSLCCFSNKATKLASTLLQLTLFSGSSPFSFSVSLCSVLSSETLLKLTYFTFNQLINYLLN